MSVRVVVLVLVYHDVLGMMHNPHHEKVFRFIRRLLLGLYFIWIVGIIELYYLVCSQILQEVCQCWLRNTQ